MIVPVTNMWPELRNAPVGPGRLVRNRASGGPGRRLQDTAFKSEYLEKSGKITIDVMLHGSYNHDSDDDNLKFSGQ